jgi:hypothetical protein
LRAHLGDFLKPFQKQLQLPAIELLAALAKHAPRQRIKLHLEQLDFQTRQPEFLTQLEFAFAGHHQ